MIRRIARYGLLTVLALFVLPLCAQGQSNLRIVGALSNFDCYNNTGMDANGFEIEIEGIHKEDVVHTWNFSAYGAPTVTDGGTPSAPSAIIRYYSNSVVVPDGSVTHFGVSLSYYTQPGAVLRRWLPKPNADIPNPPPVPFVLPSHQSQVTVLNGAETVHDTITNDTPDGTTIFWVLPFGNHVPRKVDLEELMPDNAIAQSAVPLGGGSDHLKPSRLDPGATWTNDDPAGSDDTDSAVLWYEVYEDVVTVNPHGKDTHSPGRLLGRMLDATITVIAAATPNSLALSDTSVYGTQTVIGTVTLVGEAPLGGTAVTLASDNSAAIVPAGVTIPANQFSATFAITTQAVAALTNANITASAGGTAVGLSFAIKPPDLVQLWLPFLSVHSGATFSGTVFLTSPAPANGAVVPLTGDSPMARIPTTVTVPAGATSVDFPVVTRLVFSTTKVTFTATYNGAAQTTTLQLQPNFGIALPVTGHPRPAPPPPHRPGHGR